MYLGVKSPPKSSGNVKKNKVVAKSVVLRKYAKKDKVKVIKLPDAIRTTQFAEFMLEDRFKMQPANVLEHCADFPVYSFPRFNKCDALLYFPSSMASFVNSGDMDSLSELCNSFLHRNCVVCMPHTWCEGMSHAPSLLDFFTFMNELHPDGILCMHSTKQVNEEVHSRLYFKLTENKTVYQSVSQMYKNSFYAPILVSSRSQHLRMKFPHVEETNQFAALLDDGADVHVLGHCDLRLRFNKHSKAIMEVNLAIVVTSLQIPPAATPDGLSEL